MLSSHSRVLVTRTSIVVAVCLLLVASGSAQQLTISEMALLRDNGLISAADVAAAYDRQLSNEKAQIYRSALKKLVNGEDRKAVAAFLNAVDASGGDTSQREKNKTTLVGVGCPQDVCKNMAICIPADRESNRAFTCLCPDGYYGESCQYDDVECVRQPCQHDGDCRKDVETEKGYKCVCPVGYTGIHCEFPVSYEDKKAVNEDVSGDPVFLSYIALWCLLAVACGLSLVISIEAERRLMYERYKLYTALGYAIPFPRLEFSRMVRRAFRHCICCIPEEESEFPEIPGSANPPQTEATPSGKVTDNVTKP